MIPAQDAPAGAPLHCDAGIGAIEVSWCEISAILRPIYQQSPSRQQRHCREACLQPAADRRICILQKSVIVSKPECVIS